MEIEKEKRKIEFWENELTFVQKENMENKIQETSPCRSHAETRNRWRGWIRPDCRNL